MISIVRYLFEEFVSPSKIREGIVLTKRTPYDIKSMQAKSKKEYSGTPPISYNPAAKREAILRRTTMI